MMNYLEQVKNPYLFSMWGCRCICSVLPLGGTALDSLLKITG